MILLDALSDRYARMARARPAFIVLFPALVDIIVLFPALQVWWSTLLAVVGGCGVAASLADFAQARGKGIEADLIEQWDGLPSVAMLRHRDGRLDAVTKDRYKRFLATQDQGLQFPNQVAEGRDPDAADALYASACRWLLAHTRDRKAFSLLFEQNISYGFRRNSFGLRAFGLFVSALAVGGVVAAIGWRLVEHEDLGGELSIALAIACIAVLYWRRVVNPSWVKIAADAYAYQLLAACDHLAKPPSAATRSPRRKAS